MPSLAAGSAKDEGIVLRAQLEQGSKYSASLRGEEGERLAMNINQIQSMYFIPFLSRGLGQMEPPLLRMNDLIFCSRWQNSCLHPPTCLCL